MKCWLPSIKGVGENREYLKNSRGLKSCRLFFYECKLKVSLLHMALNKLHIHMLTLPKILFIFFNKYHICLPVRLYNQDFRLLK